MSLSVITPPAAVAPIGNDIQVSLQTDNRLSTAGSAATLTFTFTGIDTTAGNTFTLEYGDVSLQFYLAAVPDDSGTQIRTASGGEPVDYWLQNFAEDLMRNYYLKKDFDCVTDLNDDTIVLTAKETGTNYSCTVDFENLSNVAIAAVAGVDQVAREDFEIILITELYDGSDWIHLCEDRIAPDLNNQADFFLQDLFTPELTAEFCFPEVPETYHELRKEFTKQYRISHAELYDDLIHRLSSAATYRAILGGFDYKMVAALNGIDFSLTDFITTYKSFLTWQPVSKVINFTQPEKLFFLVFNSISSIETHIRVYFTDGTSSTGELVTITPVSQYQVYEFMVGYSQIDFTKFNPTSKPIEKYEIWLEDDAGNVQSQVRTFILETKTYRNERIFLFRNSFGGFDTLRATGRKTQVNEYERMILERNSENFSLQQQMQALERSVFTINTGWLTYAQRLWLRELLISSEVYEIIGDYKFPIILTDEKKDLKDDDNYLHSLEINYKYAFKDPVYSGDYTAMPLLAENFETLLNEDGEPLFA